MDNPEAIIFIISKRCLCPIFMEGDKTVRAFHGAILLKTGRNGQHHSRYGSDSNHARFLVHPEDRAQAVADFSDGGAGCAAALGGHAGALV